MPTQIPDKTCTRRDEPPGSSTSRTATHGRRSFRAEAWDILMQSLLAAAIIYTVAFVIIWAYS
jgi:hypothetical protein